MYFYAKLFNSRIDLTAKRQVSKEANLKLFLLIETMKGWESRVARTLREVKPEILSADTTTGQYDVICCAECTTDVGALVVGKVHPIEGVLRVTTATVIDLP